jgi:predicted ATPase
MYLDSTPTEKQLNMLVHLIEGNRNSETLKRFWEAQPKHDMKHTDDRCDYRRQILYETLKGKIKSRNYASLIIQKLSDNDFKKAIEIFKNLGLTI